MRNKMIIIIGSIVLLFGALYFVIDYKNKKSIEGVDHPYGDKKIEQATIDQLDDPLYQNVITAEDLRADLEAEEDVTVYFYSPTCVHCQKTTPVLVPITEELGVDMKKVNLLEEDDNVGPEFDVTGTPTLIHYEDGEEVARIGGQQSDKVFESFLNDYAVK